MPNIKVQNNFSSFLPRNKVRGKLQQSRLWRDGFPFARLRAEALLRASTGMTEWVS